MTDRNKFEQMLEYLIAEEQEKAQEIFHQIVVEKSREIYENILAEDFEENVEFDEAGPVGGDATDDFISDVEPEDEFGDEEGEDEFGDEEGEDELEDRVMDLEDALDELKAEFEKLMSDEGEEEMGDDSEEEMDFGDEEDEEQPKEDFFREYVEKVAAPKMGDDGAN